MVCGHSLPVPGFEFEPTYDVDTYRGELELRIEGNNAVGTLSVTNGAVVGKPL